METTMPRCVLNKFMRPSYNYQVILPDDLHCIVQAYIARHPHLSESNCLRDIVLAYFTEHPENQKETIDVLPACV